MERKEISIHEVKLFLALKAAGATWTTSKDLAAATGVAERTARAHMLKLARLNIADLAEVFPAHRYRLAEKAAKRAYMARLLMAVEVFGLAADLD